MLLGTKEYVIWIESLLARRMQRICALYLVPLMRFSMLNQAEQDLAKLPSFP